MYIVAATDIALLIHTKESVFHPCPNTTCELSKFTLIGKAKMRFLQYVCHPILKRHCKYKENFVKDALLCRLFKKFYM